MEKNEARGEIHAVELVRKIRDQHSLELHGKTAAERIAFYQEEARNLHAKLAKNPEKRKTDVPSQIVSVKPMIEVGELAIPK